MRFPLIKVDFFSDGRCQCTQNSTNPLNGFLCFALSGRNTFLLASDFLRFVGAPPGKQHRGILGIFFLERALFRAEEGSGRGVPLLIVRTFIRKAGGGVALWEKGEGKFHVNFALLPQGSFFVPYF